MSHYTGAVPTTEPAGQWVKKSACRTDDAAYFFPKGTTGAYLLIIDDAKAICHRCPVIQQCGQWALDTRQEYGIWGGMTEAERRSILRRRGRGNGRGAKKATPPKTPRKPAECGTRGGYQKHLRDKTEICTPCRQANRDADNRLRRTGTTKAAV